MTPSYRKAWRDALLDESLALRFAASTYLLALHAAVASAFVLGFALGTLVTL